MIYDTLPVALLSTLATEDGSSVNAQLARHLLAHMGDDQALSVKELAAACHVGVGTVSRFAKEVGFESFAALREAFAQASRSYVRAEGTTPELRADALLAHTQPSLARVAHGVDPRALQRLVDDIGAYQKVSAFGMLKAQAAALELQVGLLMQGVYVTTYTSYASQIEHISQATDDELVVVFSYTGSYFDARDLGQELRRLDRPKIWMVAGTDGTRRAVPPYVADALLFPSDLGPFGHPYQLLFAADLIAQEVAARA